jgi:hypothetical protein
MRTITTENEIHLGNSSHKQLKCPAARGRSASGNSVMCLADGTICIAPSSRRYKSNIAPITEDAVVRFEAMEPVSYNYTESGQFQLGFIAEDAMPEVLLSPGRHSAHPAPRATEGVDGPSQEACRGVRGGACGGEGSACGFGGAGGTSRGRSWVVRKIERWKDHLLVTFMTQN